MGRGQHEVSVRTKDELLEMRTMQRGDDSAFSNMLEALRVFQANVPNEPYGMYHYLTIAFLSGAHCAVSLLEREKYKLSGVSRETSILCAQMDASMDKLSGPGRGH